MAQRLGNSLQGISLGECAHTTNRSTVSRTGTITIFLHILRCVFSLVCSLPNTQFARSVQHIMCGTPYFAQAYGAARGCTHTHTRTHAYSRGRASHNAFSRNAARAFSIPFSRAPAAHTRLDARLRLDCCMSLSPVYSRPWHLCSPRAVQRDARACVRACVDR